MITGFVLAGFVAHAMGMMASVEGEYHAAGNWFVSGVVMWIGGFVVLGFFYVQPVTSRRWKPFRLTEGRRYNR